MPAKIGAHFSRSVLPTNFSPTFEIGDALAVKTLTPAASADQMIEGRAASRIRSVAPNADSLYESDPASPHARFGPARGAEPCRISRARRPNGYRGSDEGCG